MGRKRLLPNRRRLSGGIADLLRERIGSGELAAGEMLPTARELAKRYSVSQVTANRAVALLAEEGLLHRSQGRGSFVAEKPTPVRSGPQLCLGLAFHIPSGERDGVHVAFELFQEAAMAKVLLLGHEPQLLSHAELRGSDLARIDGVLTSCSCLDPETIRNLRRRGKDVVVIQQTNHLDLPFHQVVPDLNSGFEEELKLLSAQVAGPVFLAAEERGHQQRIDTFLQVAGNLGVDITPVYEKKLLGDLGRMAGYKLGRKLVAAGARAVFSVSDFISFGIVDAAQEAGLSLGEDFFLASFDDLEGDGLLPFGEPRLTSLAFPKKKIAARAVELLAARPWGDSGELLTVRMPTPLSIRQSCPTPKTNGGRHAL